MPSFGYNNDIVNVFETEPAGVLEVRLEAVFSCAVLMLGLPCCDVFYSCRSCSDASTKTELFSWSICARTVGVSETTSGASQLG